MVCWLVLVSPPMTPLFWYSPTRFSKKLVLPLQTTLDTFLRKVHTNNIGATTRQHNVQDMKSKPDKKHATPVMVTKQDVTNSQTGAHCSESCSIHSKGHLVL